MTVVRSPAADTPFDRGWSDVQCIPDAHSSAIGYLSARAPAFRTLSSLCPRANLTDPSIVTIDGLGKGTVDLSGPWRFHIGDDLRWAEPSINDTPGKNGWETILADRPWGAQSHYAYAGFA